MIEVTSEFLRRMPLPDPQEGDKKARGDVLVIAGGPQVPGAALLSGVAALRAGAGRLQIATCARNATGIAVALPEAFVLGLPETPGGGIAPSAIERLSPYLKQADSVLIGPGLEDEEAIAALVSAILETVEEDGPAFVFDARAIKSLRAASRRLARYRGGVIVTPHAGEMAGLMNMERPDVEADPPGTAQHAAAALSAIVALKGSRTFIASPQEEPVVCRKGNVGLATSGSGDVLAGIVAGLLARGAAPFAATCWGVYLHASAGDRLAERIGPLGFLARELTHEIPRIMADFPERTNFGSV
jgi:hydroxyethylthiazole kinase-like uncharacterized protein yjeF